MGLFVRPKSQGILTSSLYILCGAHSETAAHIFLHYPFTLDLWAPERNRLTLSSCPSSFANLWGDWKLAYIPNNEVNCWDCVQRNRLDRLAWAESMNIQNKELFYSRACWSDHVFGESLAIPLSHSQVSQAAIVCCPSAYWTCLL